MALNTVTLTWDITDLVQAGVPAVLTIVPTAVLTDTTDLVIIPKVPRSVTFTGGTGQLAGIVANDNANISPAGTGYVITVTQGAVTVLSETVQILFANGATQNLASITPASTVVTLATPAAPPGVLVLPSGDTTGATDQAAITAAEGTGKTLYFAPGTFWVTGLVKQANSIWQGAGRYQTIIKLAAGSNKDVIQGANFATLTLSGSSTGGIGGWGIRDLTFDGNKASQSGTSYGLRVFGYNFDLANVSIQNCLTDGLYTEWGNFGQPGTDRSMEARYYGLKIHDNGGSGWHNRGPHDSRAFDVTIFSNGPGLPGYWAESNSGLTTSVAAGSNGVNVSTFTGAGVLNVSSTLGYPAASISSTQGALTVATSGGTAVITYTGITATSFTGCTTVSGTGTLSTGGSVAPAGGYSANGCLLYGVHGYGASTSWQYQLDAQNDLIDCIGEVAATGSLLIRAWECEVIGGHYFVVPGAPQTGCGIQIGDAVNNVSHLRADTYVSNFLGAAAATAAINIVNDNGSNTVDALVYQSAGTAVFGTIAHSSRWRVAAVGQTTTLDAGLSLEQSLAQVQRWLPTQNQGWTLSTTAGGDQLNLNTNSRRLEHVNILDRWYAGGYVNPTVEVSGSAGTIALGSPSGAAVDTTLSRPAANVFQSSGAWAAAGLAGAISASRYAGATAAGAPGSGTFAAGDYVIDQSGAIWVCTTAGSPGTWVPLESPTWMPSDNALLAASADINGLGGTSLMIAGTLYLLQVRIRYAITASKLWFIESAAGSGASTGSFGGLYSSAGTLLTGSADAGTAFTGGFAQSITLTTPQALAAGSFVWAALLVNLATTQPTLRSVGGGSAVPGNLNLGAASFRNAVNGTGLTALPASITPSSNTGTGALPFWVGIS